jgi:hypothetical protein
LISRTKPTMRSKMLISINFLPFFFSLFGIKKETVYCAKKRSKSLVSKQNVSGTIR